MRAALAFAALLMAMAHPALAAPSVATLDVRIGPDLAAKVDDIGQRDLEILAAELRQSVERRLPSAPEGGTLTLVIDDARPNRPTPQQLMNTQGLSLRSFGLGGARISGEYVDPAGRRTPIAYSWYETDLRWAPYSSTWHDAEVAFDRLAVRLAKDQFADLR